MSTWFPWATQNTQSKTYGVFVPGIFHVAFSDHSFPRETEAVEHETMGVSINTDLRAHLLVAFHPLASKITCGNTGSLWAMHTYIMTGGNACVKHKAKNINNWALFRGLGAYITLRSRSFDLLPLFLNYFKLKLLILQDVYVFIFWWFCSDPGKH